MEKAENNVLKEHCGVTVDKKTKCSKGFEHVERIYEERLTTCVLIVFVRIEYKWPSMYKSARK